MSHAKKDTNLLFGDRWENLVAKDDAGIADHVGYVEERLDFAAGMMTQINRATIPTVGLGPTE